MSRGSVGRGGWLVLVALGIGCSGEHAPAPAPEPSPVVASLGTAERTAEAGRVELVGTVTAAQTAAVTSRVAALVTAVHVDLGDRVRAGQLLVSIDPTAAQGQVSQAQGALAQATAALALAERNYQRFEALQARQAASELELDAARMQLEQAKGAVEQAKGAVSAASSVARESRVVAPFAGRVAQRMVEVGELAAPGRPLLLVESDGERRLVLSAPEALWAPAALAVGATLPVRFDGRPDLGEVQRPIAEVSPGADPLTHAYTVKVALSGLDVASGSVGRGYLPAAARETVLVPAAALIEQGGLTLVVVRGEDGQAQTRLVSLGERRPDGRVEVLAGLAGGEQLALGLAAAPPAGARLEAAQ